MLHAMIAPSKPPSNVVPARNWHFQYLADNLRPDEIEHWKAVSGADAYDPDVAARGYLATPGMKVSVMGADGMPVVAGGAHETDPGVWLGWMVGSMAGWGSHWRAITKTNRWLMGQLFAGGARRIYVSTITTREQACRWYEKALGMTREGVHRRAGAQGQDIVFYSRIAEDGQP